MAQYFVTVERLTVNTVRRSDQGSSYPHPFRTEQNQWTLQVDLRW